MICSRFFVCCLVISVAVVVATAAHAFDVTGTWTGTYKCKGSFGGEKDAYEDELTALVSQSGSAVGASISFSGTIYQYSGLAVADAAKPDKGDLMLAICGTDDDLQSGVFDEIGRLKVVTKPSKGSGVLSGTSHYASTGPAQAYTCKWKLKRTSGQGLPVPIYTCP